MAIVYSPNVIEIAVNHTHSGKPAVNVWHMWFDAELGSDTQEDVVRDFANNWQDHVLDLVCNNLALVDFEWRSIDPNNSTVGVIAPDAAKPTTGQLAGPAAPPNVALLLHKNTDNRPRGRRDGRSYLAGVDETQVGNGGALSAAVVSSADTNLAAFYNGISDTSGTAAGDRYPCVLETTPESRTAGTQSVTIASRRVTSVTLDALVATQRDRLR